MCLCVGWCVYNSLLLDTFAGVWGWCSIGLHLVGKIFPCNDWNNNSITLIFDMLFVYLTYGYNNIILLFSLCLFSLPSARHYRPMVVCLFVGKWYLWFNLFEHDYNLWCYCVCGCNGGASNRKLQFWANWRDVQQQSTEQVRRPGMGVCCFGFVLHVVCSHNNICKRCTIVSVRVALILSPFNNEEHYSNLLPDTVTSFPSILSPSLSRLLSLFRLYRE